MSDLYKAKSLGVDKKIGLLRIKINIATTKLKQTKTNNGSRASNVQLKFIHGKFKKMVNSEELENPARNKLHSRS